MADPGYSPSSLRTFSTGKKIASGLLSPLRMACSFWFSNSFKKVDQPSLAIGRLDGFPRGDVADGWDFLVDPVVKLPRYRFPADHTTLQRLGASSRGSRFSPLLDALVDRRPVDNGRTEHLFKDRSQGFRPFYRRALGHKRVPLEEEDARGILEGPLRPFLVEPVETEHLRRWG